MNTETNRTYSSAHSGDSASRKSDLAFYSLNQSLNELQDSFRRLAYAHTKRASERLLDGLVSTFSLIDRKVAQINDWARTSLHEHHHARKEKIELELQIGAMEGEGNIPSGGEAQSST